MAKNARRTPCPRAAPTDRTAALPADTTALEARITELEIKLSFAEDTIDGLNATVFRQQQTMEALAADLRALRQQVSSSLPAEARSLRDELPPHY